MSAEPHHERRPAWRVLRAMERELQNQGRTDALAAGRLNFDGEIELAGAVDLAALAHVAEMALRSEFGS
jgi:hypothetical protein